VWPLYASVLAVSLPPESLTEIKVSTFFRLLRGPLARLLTLQKEELANRRALIKITNCTSLAMSTQDLQAFFEVNGVFIPAVGLGTFQGPDGNDRVKEIVLKALQKGYRHLDTATAYGNEKEVGEAIKESGIRREEIFIITKL
jgi:hypothetical protein